MNANKYLFYSTRRYTSLLKKLRAEEKINEEFEVLMNGLSLEEVIALKLELSLKTLNSPLYGFSIWKLLPVIVQDAVLKFAISTTQTSSEAASLLGLTQFELRKKVKKFFIRDYFGSIRHAQKRKAAKQAGLAQLVEP